MYLWGVRMLTLLVGTVVISVVLGVASAVGAGDVCSWLGLAGPLCSSWVLPLDG